jgi:hypothetical protein
MICVVLPQKKGYRKLWCQNRIMTILNHSFSNLGRANTYSSQSGRLDCQTAQITAEVEKVGSPSLIVSLGKMSSFTPQNFFPLYVNIQNHFALV